MEKFQELVEFAEILGVKTAVVQVKPGESNQEAWNRHLKKKPDDASAMVKIFNELVTLELIERVKANLSEA